MSSISSMGAIWICLNPLARLSHQSLLLPGVGSNSTVHLLIAYSASLAKRILWLTQDARSGFGTSGVFQLDWDSQSPAAYNDPLQQA